MWFSSLWSDFYSGALSVQKMKSLKMKVSDSKLRLLQHLSLVEQDRKGQVRLVKGGGAWGWDGCCKKTCVHRSIRVVRAELTEETQVHIRFFSTAVWLFHLEEVWLLSSSSWLPAGTKGKKSSMSSTKGQRRWTIWTLYNWTSSVTRGRPWPWPWTPWAVVKIILYIFKVILTVNKDSNCKQFWSVCV